MTWACALALAALVPTFSGCRWLARARRRVYRTVARSGVRAGRADLGGFELRGEEARPLVGLYYRLSTRGPILYELGLDAAVDTDAPGERQLYAARADLLFFPNRREKAYLHAGGGGLHEVLPVNAYTAGYVGFGAGWSFYGLGTELDVRVTKWKVLESGNAQDGVVLALGFAF